MVVLSIASFASGVLALVPVVHLVAARLAVDALVAPALRVARAPVDRQMDPQNVAKKQHKNLIPLPKRGSKFT